MRIMIANGSATIIAGRKEANRLSSVASESYFVHDKDDLRARTGLVPEFLLQFLHLLVRNKESRLRVVAPLFDTEPFATGVELVIDGDTVTMRLTQAGLRALGESIRLAVHALDDRADYWFHTGVAQADALALADVLTTDAVLLDVTVPLERGREESENPRRPRNPPAPGTVRPSSRFMRTGPYLQVYDEDEGEWVPEGGLRGGWAIPLMAPRPCPKQMSIYEMDMVAQPDLRMPFEPNTLYRVSLPGGIEVDYYTDPWARAGYVETVPGTTAVPNPVLDDPQPVTTYVVHPADGRYAAVVRTDDQARVVEILNDPVAPLASYGQAEHQLATFLGGWPGRLGPGALLETMGESAAASLDAVASRLVEPVNDGRYAGVRLRASYDGTGAVPSGFQVECSIGGQVSTDHIPNR